MQEHAFKTTRSAGHCAAKRRCKRLPCYSRSDQLRNIRQSNGALCNVCKLLFRYCEIGVQKWFTKNVYSVGGICHVPAHLSRSHLKTFVTFCIRGRHHDCTGTTRQSNGNAARADIQRLRDANAAGQLGRHCCSGVSCASCKGNATKHSLSHVEGSGRLSQ